MTGNPWISQHYLDETAIQDGNERIAAALVANEYDDAPNGCECVCGGMAHYKATIGALKCVSCGALYHANGAPI